MAKPKAKKKTAPRKTASFGPRSRQHNPILGTVFMLIGMLLLVSLLDYVPTQSPSVTTEATVQVDPADKDAAEQNAVGVVGAQMSFHSLRIFGLGAFSLPLYCFWLSYMGFFGHTRQLNLLRLGLLAVSVLGVSSLGAALGMRFFEEGGASNYYPAGIGGLAGNVIYRDLLLNMIKIGPMGSLLVVLALFFGGNMALLYDNLARVDNLKRAGGLIGVFRGIKLPERRKKETPEEEAPAKKQTIDAPPPMRFKAIPGKKKKGPDEEEADEIGVEIKPPPGNGGTKKKKAAKASKPEPVEEADDGVYIEPPDDIDIDISKFSKSTKTAPEPEKDEPEIGPLKIVQSEKTRKASAPLRVQQGDYKFPPMSLLAESEGADDTATTDDHSRTADILVRTLAEFGVKVTMGEVHAGPVITRYDVYPAPGVRVEKILNLDKNIALGLKALSVRILAPVPGKGCVGIEVPNSKPLSVCLRDILESADWVENKAEIPIALGKEVSGRPMIADLTKMPHLLVAGSTGSGKTVCINSVVASLLYHSAPEDLRFVMVDPKIVEMQVFNDLPHMLIPVVTDPKKVPGALKYLLKEMEKRYQRFASIGVRNIAGYNAKMAKKADEDAEKQAAELDASLSPEERAALNSIEVKRDPDVEGEMPEKLPYIVCIVDELADLMMVAPADIETGIARLAQLARAAGIHLILATQRPSVNVITGVIKANLPSRISFKVASKVDSRTILDTQGADHLIGRGDMLFLPPGSADLIRSQGAFVSDDEINGIVEFIKSQNGEPIFDEDFQATVEAGGEEDGAGPEGGGEWDDELVPKAIEVLRSSKRASTSMLQRRLKIGYNRAARIMEILEDEGIVGPENGSSPREILKDLESL